MEQLWVSVLITIYCKEQRKKITHPPPTKKKKNHVSPMRIEKCIYLGTNLRVYEMV